MPKKENDWTRSNSFDSMRRWLDAYKVKKTTMQLSFERPDGRVESSRLLRMLPEKECAFVK